MVLGNDGASQVTVNPLLHFRMVLLSEFTVGCIVEGIIPDADLWELYLMLHMPSPHQVFTPSVN